MTGCRMSGRSRRNLAQGGGALGDPGAVVEQPGDRQERRDIDRLGAEQRGGPRRRPRRPSRLHRPADVGDGDARVRRQRARGADAANGARAGIRIGGVVAGDHALHRQRRIHRAGEHRDRVDRAAGRHHAARRDAADGRLQPDDVAERRRHAARTRRCRCRARTARSRPPPRRPSPRTSRPAHARRRTRCAACRTGCACRPARWRTDRDWSCRSAPRRRRAARCTAGASASAHRRSRGRRRWSAGRRRRCCPSPRTARPRAGGPADPPPPAPRARQHRRVGQPGDPDRGIGVRAVGGERRFGRRDRAARVTAATLIPPPPPRPSGSRRGLGAREAEADHRRASA